MDKETFTYKTADDLAIEADVYRTETAAPAPVLVYIHGGALMFGARTGIKKEQLEHYLAWGYTVVSIDYRLAPETKLPGIIADLNDAMTWVHDEGPKLLNVDAARIGVVGHSAGGYLALMAGCCSPVRPSAVVSFYGYGDIVGDWYAKPDTFYNHQMPVSKEEAAASVGDHPISYSDDFHKRWPFYLYCRQQGLWPNEVGGRDPETDPEFFQGYCPEKNVTPAFPPTLLLHGDADTDVPHTQSLQMDEAFKAAGVDHELIIVPGGAHGFDGAGMENPAVADVFEHVRAFLARHVQGEATNP